MDAKEAAAVKYGLSKDAVKDGIAALPERLRKLANDKFRRKPKGLRRGSKKFARKNPKLAVSDKEKRTMAALHKAGMSHRIIEAVFGLVPNSGMDAFRCIAAARKAKARAKRSKAKAAKKPAAPAAAVAGL